MTKELTPEEAAAILNEIRTPKLDELRAKVPSMATSVLLAFVVNPEQLEEYILPKDLDSLSPEQELAIMGAALVTIGKELDIRIPTRIPAK